MPKDYAPRQTSRHKASNPALPWHKIAGLAAAVILLAGGSTVYLWHARSSRQHTNTGNHQTVIASTQTHRLPPPRFEFYSLLPNTEMISHAAYADHTEPKPTPSSVPLSTAAANKKDAEVLLNDPQANTEPTIQTSTTSATNKHYFLQVAAFRQVGDAQSLRAHLLLLGLNSPIVIVKSQDGQFNRVRVGPVDNRDTAQKLKDQLAQSDYNAFILMQ